jgi:hypothetical protein
MPAERLVVMREVAKSMLGFSWAVSLFGIQQISKLMTPSAQPDAAVQEFDAVSRAVQSHLTQPVAEQFRAADEWQRRVVDAMFDVGTLQSLDPRTMAASLDPRRVVEALDPRGMMQSGVDVLQKSVDAIRQTVQPAPAAEVPTE